MLINPRVADLCMHACPPRGRGAARGRAQKPLKCTMLMCVTLVQAMVKEALQLSELSDSISYALLRTTSSSNSELLELEVVILQREVVKGLFAAEFLKVSFKKY